jgi:hypothetical protein
MYAQLTIRHRTVHTVRMNCARPRSPVPRQARTHTAVTAVATLHVESHELLILCHSATWLRAGKRHESEMSYPRRITWTRN